MSNYELKMWQKAKIYDKMFGDEKLEGKSDGVLYDAGFGSEIDIEDLFDKNIFDCKWVDAVEKEVDGEYYRRINGKRPVVRIDRLITTKCGQYVGVELKASNQKLGKAVCQIIDYTNSAFWSVRNSEQVFFPEKGWIATFPLSTPLSGPISSVIMQHRIARFENSFILKHGSNLIATPQDDRIKMMPPVRKVGSR